MSIILSIFILISILQYLHLNDHNCHFSAETIILIIEKDLTFRKLVFTHNVKRKKNVTARVAAGDYLIIIN